MKHAVDKGKHAQLVRAHKVFSVLPSLHSSSVPTKFSAYCAVWFSITLSTTTPHKQKTNYTLMVYTSTNPHKQDFKLVNSLTNPHK